MKVEGQDRDPKRMNAGNPWVDLQVNHHRSDGPEDAGI